MSIIDLLIIIIILGWAGGYSFHFGGDLIHVLLLVALVLLVVRLLPGRRK